MVRVSRIVVPALAGAACALAFPLSAQADATEDLFKAAMVCDDAGVKAALGAGVDPNALNA